MRHRYPTVPFSLCFYLFCKASVTLWKNEDQFDKCKGELFLSIRISLFLLIVFYHYRIIFCNPASDRVDLRFYSSSVSNTIAEVFSITGKKIISKNVNSNEGDNMYSINVFNFENGTYIVRIMNEGNALLVKKIQVLKNKILK